MGKYNCQLELVSIGVCPGGDVVKTNDLAEKEWVKYDANDLVLLPRVPQRTSAEDIISRLGVESRPRVRFGQTHSTMFNDAFNDALQRAKDCEVGDIEGNIIAVYAASSTPKDWIPNYLDEVCEHIGFHKGTKEFVMWACSGFNRGVNLLSHCVENSSLEGYAVVGASEILGPCWKPDNFDSMLFGDLAAVGIFKITQRKTFQTERRIVGCVDNYYPYEDIVWIGRFLYMNGRAVQRVAPVAMIARCQESVALAELSMEDVDTFIFHPGSAHVVSALANKMKRICGGEFDVKKQLPHYLGDNGNNGAATTPNILHRQIDEGKIGNEDIVYVGAFGAVKPYAYESSFVINGFPFLKK